MENFGDTGNAMRELKDGSLQNGSMLSTFVVEWPQISELAQT